MITLQFSDFSVQKVYKKTFLLVTSKKNKEY